MNQEIKILRKLTRLLIDIDVCILNNKFCEAYYLLNHIDIKDLENIVIDLKCAVRDKVFEMHGDKKD